ncbi:MAG: (E)-4-hydroxy-3-methylbut-2-enyl-diphosphate synthase [Muribaculaceae bacterium]|nr:(E)-4-hydroxy-3-methylbut-2-enyl-diphosphate synthase [Muribaculaceae bacterium]
MAARRHVTQTHVGRLTIGAPAPVVVQSMTTTPTLDTEASVRQTESIAAAGAQLVRLTAQGVSHAANLANIKAGLTSRGCDVPLVADIHFNPAAAFEAALHVEKVRVNPGNFFDPGRKFMKMEFTDEEYAAELEGIRAKFIPFLNLCRENGTAIRIGVNHGSLSDRIMSRFGDGADGMVESALEFLRICRDEHFDDVVVSIKASDVPVMTDTVRLLVAKMEAEGMAYPLHLGVTEAGNALDGRIKSAVGIGSLLADGIGDTIRVSLSENPENEVPVAHQIIRHCMEELALSDAPVRGRSAGRRLSREANGIGGLSPTAILGDTIGTNKEGVIYVTADKPGRIEAYRRAIRAAADTPVVTVVSYPDITDKDELIVAAAIDLGSLLLEGYRDGIGIISPLLNRDETTDLCRRIIQSAGLARYQAEIVACPGCGRTLYDLPEALEKVKEACLHLKHLKIAVMGCIVNGPGEMSGADYGYVGAGPGNISLYRGIECVYKNIPREEALDRLIDIIKADGRWIEKGDAK